MTPTMTPTNLQGSKPATVDLYWLPLGAGTANRCVRWSGRAYESLLARHERRPPLDLYHSALTIGVDGEVFVIEMTPSWGASGIVHGVASQGPVGMAWLGRSRFFRYEVRRWRGGAIDDVAEAVSSPRRLSSDPAVATRMLRLVAEFPTATWGRDGLDAGEMWNSNSLVSWLLVRSGLDAESVEMPGHGRAPGWRAGVIVARRALNVASADPAVEPTSSQVESVLAR